MVAAAVGMKSGEWSSSFAKAAADTFDTRALRGTLRGPARNASRSDAGGENGISNIEQGISKEAGTDIQCSVSGVHHSPGKPMETPTGIPAPGMIGRAGAHASSRAVSRIPAGNRS